MRTPSPITSLGSSPCYRVLSYQHQADSASGFSAKLGGPIVAGYRAGYADIDDRWEAGLCGNEYSLFVAIKTNGESDEANQ